MYGQGYHFRPRGGARGAVQPQPPPHHFFPQNPNHCILNSTPYLQNPNFSASHNPYIQNPSFPIQQFPNTQRVSPNPKETLERIDRAVATAHRDLLATGESVSSWRVSELALLSLRVDSWSSLGFQMQQVPSLSRLMATEGKVNSFIHCFVGARRITSLFELDLAICKNEGVEQFEELKLGPLLRHPLVVHYFSVSSDAKEIFKITSKEIISCLAEYMDSHKVQDIQAEGFLDFLAMKRSVADRENLGVRIQSLRMHTAIIQEATKAEESTLKKYLQVPSSKQTKKMKGRLKHHTSISAQKEVLERRFKSISQSFKLFSSINEDFGGKHTRFVSSSSEDESDANDDSDTEDDCKGDNVPSSRGKISSEKRNSCDQRVNTCPYPSADEEMARLGLKMEMGGQPSPVGGSLRCKKRKSGEKRKRGNQSANVPFSHKFPKRDDAESNEVDLDLVQENANNQPQNAKSQSAHGDADNIGGLALTSDTMEEFITTWKETCRMHSVAEVFDRMLRFYHTAERQREQFGRIKKMKSSIKDKETEKVKSLFSLFPCIGLLNVAVTSIKLGMWDSLYDTFQAIGQNGCVAPISTPSEFERIVVEPSSKNNALSINEPSSQLEYSVSCSLRNSGVTVDDIIKKVATYFEDHPIRGEGKSSVEKQFMCLRKLHDCEMWLTKQFSVKEFDSLGCGEFFKFLEEHSSMLPNEFLEGLTGDLSQKSLLEVSVLQNQLLILLSQAASNLWENGIITKQHISMLLRKQFPLISFQLNGNDSLEDLSEILKKHRNRDIFSCVLFSVTLFETWYTRDSLVENHNHLSETTGVIADQAQEAGPLGSVSAKDAIECLLKAPMLSDLQSWSHWDLIFAPSLGPLVEWLLNEVHTKELLCLMTKDGKLIRIDHTATVDEFLEASIKGSSFQTAVKLLSLFSLYGGERHAPLTLLKCHARRAIEVILKNSIDSTEVKTTWDIDMHAKALSGQVLDEKNSANPFILHPSGTVVDMSSREQFENQFRINKAAPLASRFILDCLGYLPPEFRHFAADVLLSGLRSFTKDASSAILRECRKIDHRLMLHEIGLSLGILEWIADYHAFSSSTTNELFVSFGTSSVNASSPVFGLDLKYAPDASENLIIFDDKVIHPVEVDGQNEVLGKINDEKGFNDVSNENCDGGCERFFPKHDEDQDAAFIIESIRREEFGLVPSLTHEESSILKKQHARLGRALHCLSQELYSQDSHFLLELVQNADDNIYPEKVVPTLVFILQATGIIILNNEQGFSEKNIRALCDVGNSTKRGSSAGYIGQKGIGFKSVFRVTDAPEIHSNGFHVKFDISEGQIGFVLPTVVSPCDIDSFRRLVPSEVDQIDTTCWNTCIVLPFKSNLREGTGISTITYMFSDLHPSLLLFLHRLQCIKFKNMHNDSFIVMRRETVGNGIVKVSYGKEKMTWFVATQKLEASVIRPGVQSTEIAIALTLQESANGEYSPHLDQQPVFAFLPLRTYGLKFILQGDFFLTSSREEVDGDSAWNQWLLSELPGLFVNAQRSFCDLPCFQESPGKAVAAYMSYVPLVGEVHGFFSHLPRMIISKLRISSCLLLEGHNNEWVPPCKVLRGWNDYSSVLLPESLLQEHLGLGYLDKNIILSDPLAKALGVQDYGPKILIEIISSICHTNNGIKLLGLEWLSSWLNALYNMLVHSSRQSSLNAGIESDINKFLRKIPFIPLSDGTYSSVDEGTIWLPCDAISSGFEGEHGPEAFPSLYAKLRTVSTALFHAATINTYSMEEKSVDNIIRMLHRIGVEQFTAHEIIRVHILPAICDDRITNRDNNLMTEYLSFVMLHLQSSCSSCRIEREYIVSELQNKAFILTNHGYKRPVEVPIHFSREFGNPIDVHKLIDTEHSKWHEVDIIYLTHPSTKTLSFGLMKWREFLQEFGVTDFVQVVESEKNMIDASNTVLKSIMCDGGLIPHISVIKDWESSELVHMLSVLSSQNNQEKCKYLLEVLDKMWDDCFSAKVTGCCISISIDDSKTFKSSFIRSIHDVQWMASSMDQMLHYPKDLFYDCEAVRSILGAFVPYAAPQVRSIKFLHDIGFKTHVTLDDALEILRVWRRSKTPFKASVAQMSKFYAFIWDEISTSKAKITAEFSSGPSVFVPYANVSKHEDVVPGIFLSLEEVYWQDPTGSLDRTKELLPQCGSLNETNCPISMTLSHVYQHLHDFFVNECGVREIPPFRSYLQILLKLSYIALPSLAANSVFQVLLRLADDLKSGLVGSEDVIYLKDYLLKLESTVLPTVQDKWVSLHPSFGIVCWCDDDELKKQFKHSDNIDFLYFGELSNDKKEMIPAKVAGLMQTMGVPSLSEVVTREAIFYGMEDQRDKASLLNWVLPYAQRYIYKLHLDKYFQLKLSGFENLSNLRIFVVEKLFYKHIIKGCDSASKKRFECSCLLQDSNLYMTRDSDSHSIFLELSRLFFNGIPELHLANFLHMIATMAESGSTKEQTEFFIFNSQKVPKLPDEEPVWFISSSSLLQEDETGQKYCFSATDDEKNLSSKRKPGINPNWPPVDWKTAPDFSFSQANRFRTFPGAPPPSEGSQKKDKHEGVIPYTDNGVPVGIGVDWIIEEDSAATTMALVLQDSRAMEDQHPSVGSSGPVCIETNSSLEVFNESAAVVGVPENLDPDQFDEREQLSFGTRNEYQAAITGRLGEFIAFKYFAEKVGESCVKWVNEETETGLPYDIIIREKEEHKEYIEVKATKYAKKDWFNISSREWQFAVDRGESFSIAHIVLMGPNNAKVTVFKNPVKLCQQGMLQLAVLMSKHQKKMSIVS